jgi:hypothetical protein
MIRRGGAHSTRINHHKRNNQRELDVHGQCECRWQDVLSQSMILAEQGMIDLLRSHRLLYLISSIDVPCNCRHRNTLPRFISGPAGENK